LFETTRFSCRVVFAVLQRFLYNMDMNADVAQFAASEAAGKEPVSTALDGTMASLDSTIDAFDDSLDRAIDTAASNLGNLWSSISFAASRSGPTPDLVDNTGSLDSNAAENAEPDSTSANPAPPGAWLASRANAFATQAQNFAGAGAGMAAQAGAGFAAQAAQANRGLASGEALSALTGVAKNVASTVQRNASAVESAILEAANGGVTDQEIGDVDGEPLLGDGEGMVARPGDPGDVAVGDASDAAGLGLGATADDVEEDPIQSAAREAIGEYVKSDLDVGAELTNAAQTLQNSAAAQAVSGFLGSIWVSLAGDDYTFDDAEAGQREFNSTHGRAANVAVSRFQRLVLDLETNPDTYCEPAADLDALAAWKTAFSYDLEARSAECISLLERHASISDLYERVVPSAIDEETFWLRYFYARHVLDKQEEQRKNLLQRAVGGAFAEPEAESGWDDDDWDDADFSADNVKGLAADSVKGLAPDNVKRLATDADGNVAQNDASSCDTGTVTRNVVVAEQPGADPPMKDPISKTQEVPEVSANDDAEQATNDHEKKGEIGTTIPTHLAPETQVANEGEEKEDDDWE
jgi:BSD domain